MAQQVKNLPANAEDTEFDLWVERNPLEEEMATHSSILAWKISGTKELVGYSPWGCKEWDTIKHSISH